MKNDLILPQLCPRDHSRHQALPILGSHLEEFFQWLRQKGYTLCSLRSFLNSSIGEMERFFCRRHRVRPHDFCQHDLDGAWEQLRRTKKHPGVVRMLGLFLRERGVMPGPSRRPPSSLERELDGLASYLRDVRGLAYNTVRSHHLYIRSFLGLLGFEEDETVVRRVRVEQVERFLRLMSKTNGRFALQHVVAALRSYLRWKHAQGFIPEPLHERIDTPRVYRLEKLPRALAWGKISALLRSIDRGEPGACRDFTILYLAARYGLRGNELVRLRLEDIDWRAGIFRVAQTKTKQILELPLTDEAGDILSQYLRGARPVSSHRELFLTVHAPIGPMTRGNIYNVLAERVKQSGLAIGRVSPHSLRHSLATHLLREGVSMKAIGDTLGHRDVESTGIYLRLSTEDLREVGLPLPRPVAAVPLVSEWDKKIPKLRAAHVRQPVSNRFRSFLAGSLRDYLAIRRALGRRFFGEERILRQWDYFIHRHCRTQREVTAAMFQEWSHGLERLSAIGRRNKMRVVRNFLLYHSRQHPGTAIPDLALFPKPSRPQAPRLVSPREMGLILATAKQLPATFDNPLRTECVCLGLALLFCCGLRRGELLRLRVEDFDADESVLLIKQTKFHKSRLVPLRTCVANQLRHYLMLRRKRGLPLTPESHLLWSGRRPPPYDGYSDQGILHAWRRLCLSARVLDARGRPPRLHDLRHSAAVAALHRWYAHGQDPQAKLPYLATYLGHVSPISTHHYLHLTAELRRAASRRFHQHSLNLFKKGAMAP